MPQGFRAFAFLPNRNPPEGVPGRHLSQRTRHRVSAGDNNYGPMTTALLVMDVQKGVVERFPSAPSRCS
jgi:hypothetical protein